ncbi:uncharacterized protein K489DRAFT_385501 [Dissoconium aciculare CBS 342.82]|jgi:hypothetical protein|uniref:Uncharacterized protein n=1 Tax=Dissoconium aciculare CBS 342.82 TaxID=1314786 RepID=A0A6J3LRC6_9PEZI|nr:uncharacterized protein K489DRAFT_385501 [Dissoconium aciculare CBS 342.82]KAF1817829.1 hypothetical protein K489DRAFT_385501 [Dissoconium aciculare CBS 342.82]
MAPVPDIRLWEEVSPAPAEMHNSWRLPLNHVRFFDSDKVYRRVALNDGANKGNRISGNIMLTSADLGRGEEMDRGTENPRVYYDPYGDFGDDDDDDPDDFFFFDEGYGSLGEEDEDIEEDGDGEEFDGDKNIEREEDDLLLDEDPFICEDCELSDSDNEAKDK